jgi:MFS transporter, DHA2 family, multidrug resistance protein
MASAAASVGPAPVAEAGPPLAHIVGHLLMMVGMFMAILDIQIVASSMSEIQAGLAASADEIVWVQSSYLIAEIIMIPLSGFLSRALSTRWLFVASSVGFTLASILCATATSIEEMIIYRALQGFLGGAMIPTTFATTFLVYGRDRQMTPLVLSSVIVTLAPTLGPVLGGWITDYFSWHWLFLVNVIPGLLITVGVALVMRIDKPDFSLLRRLDVPGLLLMGMMLGSIEFVLEEGARKQWFEDEHIRLWSLVALCSTIAFFWRLATSPEPIVRLTPFRDYNFAACALLSTILGFSLYGLTYLYPLYLVQAGGLSSAQIGNILFVSGLFMMIGGPVSGMLARVVDVRLMASGGLLLLALSSWMSEGLTDQWRFAEFFLPQMFRGLGLMVCMVALSNSAFMNLPTDQVKDASGLFTLTRNLGGAIGLAGINTVLLWRNNFHWSRSAEFVNPARPEVQARIDSMAAGLDGSAGDATIAATQQLGRMVAHQVAVLSFADCFALMTWMFLAGAVVPLLLRKPSGDAAAVEMH